MARAGLVTALACAGINGCANRDTSEATRESDDGLGATVDTTRPPVVVSVPLHFTKNRLEDVGYFFANSTVPFTPNLRGQFNPADWAAPGNSARELAKLYEPGQIGSGYLTAKINIRIPRGTDSKPAYTLAKVGLEEEYIDTKVADFNFYRHSPLRMRTGSDQPCLSVVMTGGIEGKMSVHSIPWFDENFTEHDWTSGSVDPNGRPVKRVIVGTFWLSPIGFAEQADGATRASGGVGVAGGSVMMNLDRTSGEASSTRATVHVNLLENDRGEVSVGETFSTSGAILSPTEKQQYDERAKAFITNFVKQRDCWSSAPFKQRTVDGNCTDS